MIHHSELLNKARAELKDLQVNYETATAAEKTAMRAVISHAITPEHFPALNEWCYVGYPKGMQTFAANAGLAPITTNQCDWIYKTLWIYFANVSKEIGVKIPINFGNDLLPDWDAVRAAIVAREAEKVAEAALEADMLAADKALIAERNSPAVRLHNAREEAQDAATLVAERQAEISTKYTTAQLAVMPLYPPAAPQRFDYDCDVFALDVAKTRAEDLALTVQALELVATCAEPEQYIERAMIAATLPLLGYERGRMEYKILPRVRKLNAAVTIATPWDSTEGMNVLITAFNGNKAIAITGGMGTAKTTAVLSLCKSFTTLYVVPSRVLGQQKARELGAIYATDIASWDGYTAIGKNGKRYTSVVVCTPSLHKIADKAFQVVIVDEVMAVNRGLFFGNLCAPRRSVLVAALAGVLAASSKVVLIDANLTPNSVAVIAPKLKPVALHSTFKPMKCAVHVLQGSRVAAMAAIVEAAQQTAGKLVVHTDSVNLAERLGLMLRAAGVESLILDGDRKYDRHQHYFLTETETFWQACPEVKVVIATSVISCGYSIQGAGADAIESVWGLFQCNNGQTPDDYAQTLFRVRGNQPRYVWSAKGCSGYGMVNAEMPSGKGAVLSLFNQTQAEKCKSREYLLTYLAAQGCTLTPMTLRDTKIDLTGIGQAAVMELRTERLKAAPQISAADCASLKQQRYIHSSQRLMITRHEWEQRLGTLTDEQWKIASNEGFQSKITLAHFLINPELVQQAATPDDVWHEDAISGIAARVAEALAQPFMLTMLAPITALLSGESDDATGEGEAWEIFKISWKQIAMNLGIRGCRGHQDLIGKLCGLTGLKRLSHKENDMTRTYCLNKEAYAVWQTFMRAGNAMVEAVVGTVKKLTEKYKGFRRALGMPEMLRKPFKQAAAGIEEVRSYLLTIGWGLADVGLIQVHSGLDGVLDDNGALAA
jgi:Origin of replication binding protein